MGGRKSLKAIRSDLINESCYYYSAFYKHAVARTRTRFETALRNSGGGAVSPLTPHHIPRAPFPSVYLFIRFPPSRNVNSNSLRPVRTLQYYYYSSYIYVFTSCYRVMLTIGRDTPSSVAPNDERCDDAFLRVLAHQTQTLVLA